MNNEYGLKEFRELMEQRLKDYDNPMHIPFGMIPYSSEANCYRRWKKNAYRDVLEMIPEI